MGRPTKDEGEGLSRLYVRPLLLLLLAEGPSHGYELLEQVRRAGVRNADAGGLYRSLRAMEQERLVSSWWEPSQAGPARRSYTLTPDGRQALDGSVSSLHDVLRLVTAVVERHAALPPGAQTHEAPSSPAEQVASTQVPAAAVTSP